MNTKHELYKDANSDGDQKKTSIAILANKMNVMPWEVKELFQSQFKQGNFTKSELIETANQWRAKKNEESNFFGIKAENTTAAHMENWTVEYLNEIY